MDLTLKAFIRNYDISANLVTSISIPTTALNPCTM